jgi:hypothetical protein
MEQPIIGLVILGLVALFFRAVTDSWKYALLIVAGMFIVGAALDQAGFRTGRGDWCDINNCH